MEESPLVVASTAILRDRAHSHARRAAEETSKARLTVAGSEHESAAEQYARAVEDTSDVEVLRILKLLEDHHSKLAQIVKAKDEFSKKVSATEIKRAEEEAIQDEVASQAPTVTLSGPAQTASPEKLTTTAFLKSRDAPSSLAKDIASRRGIPQSQSRRNPGAASTLSPIQATGRMSNPPRSIVTGQHPKPPSSGHSHTSPSSSVESPADEGFSRFYSQLTSGPLSKLSSMLAFTGLPLTEPEDSLSASTSPSASTHPTQKEKSATSARVSTGPDVNALFSRAALKALEEQQRHPGPAFGPGESFYVIPTSGGTASYANILTKTREELRGQGGSKDEDEFVDAREDLESNPEMDVKSKSKHKTSVIPAVNDTDNTLREEELQIENAALKQILDKLSHRLQAFESHAQDASMAMMNQSIVSHHSRSPMGGAGTAGVREEMEERMRAMEAQLEREMKEREKLSMESQKQKLVIAKYRSHWEQLKDSARAREKAKREKGQDVKA
ncbi:hypothetical protein BDZ85DRAFT_280530 [Elsinoe ampelina]|uniref:Uncharacterized protein n=1 Tax=Elsinoe ampelina TaxID=302913 RepID=A0A6A6GHY7_9PEZI|nr:hypothetical protein BDZ85DRAFT_280530 [Elsinoe ampelina]